MSYQSEAILENELIERLVAKGYQWVPKVKNETELVMNFRELLERRNSTNIGDEPLTDKEFNRLMTQINGKSIFDSAKILRDKVLRLIYRLFLGAAATPFCVGYNYHVRLIDDCGVYLGLSTWIFCFN